MSNPYQLFDAIASRYEESIRIFESEFGDVEERRNVIYTILEHCELARCFDYKIESNLRKRDRRAIKQSKTAANKARWLSRYLQSFAFQTSVPIGAASLNSGLFLRTKNDPAPEGMVLGFAPGYSIMFAELLASLSAELEAGKLLAKAGPVWHRTAHGPLNFAMPIDDQGPLPQPPACLAIFLTFLFRKYSTDRTMKFQRGEPFASASKPLRGKSHFKLIDQLISDTVEKQIDAEDTVKKVIKKNPNLEIIGYRRSLAPQTSG